VELTNLIFQATKSKGDFGSSSRAFLAFFSFGASSSSSSSCYSSFLGAGYYSSFLAAGSFAGFFCFPSSVYPSAGAACFFSSFFFSSF
jgi:hypothetical protein